MSAAAYWSRPAERCVAHLVAPVEQRPRSASHRQRIDDRPLRDAVERELAVAPADALEVDVDPHVELDLGEVDRLLQRLERVRRVTARVDADRHVRSLAEQLDEAEVLAVATVGDVDERVAVRAGSGRRAP